MDSHSYIYFISVHLPSGRPLPKTLTMASTWRNYQRLPSLRQMSFVHTESPLELAIRLAVEGNDHRQIPHILSSPPEQQERNPFFFLASLPPFLTARIVDDILQSLIPVRPRSISYPSFSALLSLLLPNSDAHIIHLPGLNFPLSLAVLQTGLRSGFYPPPSTHRSLSLFWVHLRHRNPPSAAGDILSSTRMIGYRPDLMTLNYLLLSLRRSSQDVKEATAVLRGMGAAGCGPDAESYCHAIESCCAARNAQKAVELLKEMAAEEGMAPRKGTVGAVVAALRREGQAKGAADLVGFLERAGFAVGFEEYEAVVEGCLAREEFVAAGKMVVKMAALGFIPYVRVRQRVVEGLAEVGQQELAGAVRRSLAKIGS